MLPSINLEKSADQVVRDACAYNPNVVNADENNTDRLAQLLVAFADPIRLRLISIIASTPEKEVCACSFVGDLHRSQPTISHHLKTLTALGVCKSERRGRWIWYSLNSEIIQDIIVQLSKITEGSQA